MPNCQLSSSKPTWKRRTQWQSLGAKLHVDLQTKVYYCKVSKLRLKPILSPHYNTRFHLQATLHFLEKTKCKDSAWAINCNYTLPPYASCTVTVQTILHLLRYASPVYTGPTEFQVPVYNTPTPTKGKLKPTSCHRKAWEDVRPVHDRTDCFRFPCC